MQAPISSLIRFHALEKEFSVQQPKVYSVSDHDIDDKLIDSDALYILERLREAGFTAYLVGGSVRDLLLKKTPKDFDISTSAEPEEIKHIFHRQCILIGRRFRLAHIRFGHKIIEVSTFRSGENESDLILQDNKWGTPEEDVLRRDFTINGLFYDPSSKSIIDYVGGWEDIHTNTLRTIGESEIRFKQDPVRMIRLLKFRARFGFNITQEAKSALLKCREEILKSSPARVTEEILRMLESGASASFFRLLSDSGILNLLYPTLATFIKGEKAKSLYLYLACADKINQSQGKQPLDRPILLACLLFPMLSDSLNNNFTSQQQIPHMGEIIMQTGSTVKEFETGAFARFPRRLMAITISVLSTQYRLTPLSGKKHHHPKVFRYKDFPDALIFLKIRAIIEKELIETYTTWKSLYRKHLGHGDRRGHRHHFPPPHVRISHAAKTAIT